jgi:myo-inositol-1(or 4)-monophosphatase
MNFNNLDVFLNIIANKAAEMIVRKKDDGFQEFAKPDKKGHADYVTSVDLDIQNFLILRIKEEYPNAIIIAEEGDYLPTNIDPQGMVWSIDPIDGTGDFINGTPNVTLMISVQQQGIKGAIIINPFTTQYIQLASSGTHVSSGRRLQGYFDYRLYEINPKNKNIIGLDDVRNFAGTPVYDRTYLKGEENSEFSYYCTSGSYGDLVLKLVTGQVCAIALTATKVAPWDSLPGALIMERLGVKRFEHRGGGLWDKKDILVTNEYSNNPMTLLTLEETARDLGFVF